MIDKKDIFMSGFKSKIGYSFTYKDLNEFEAIIDFYENKSKSKKEVIDKAIEYMKKHVEIKIFSDGYELYEINNGNDKFCKELLDILEGEQNG